MDELVLNKRLGDGRRVEVRIQEYAIGHFRCLAYIDGKWIDGPAAPQLLPLPMGGNTHYMGGHNGPLIRLSTLEGEQINAALGRRQEINQSAVRVQVGRLAPHYAGQEQSNGTQRQH